MLSFAHPPVERLNDRPDDSVQNAAQFLSRSLRILSSRSGDQQAFFYSFANY
jgi:hypothetical protein